MSFHLEIKDYIAYDAENLLTGFTKSGINK